MASLSLGSPQRIAAVLVIGAMFVVPAVWIAWSLSEASAIADTNRDQSDAISTLQARLAVLNAGANGDKTKTQSVYLPGKSAAIAGAALQRIVANAVERSGGRIVQSEIARSETSEADAGTVNLRTEFETDIVGLQRIVFELETGAPILMVRALTVEAKNAAGTDSENPGLSIVLLVRGHWEV